MTAREREKLDRRSSHASDDGACIHSAWWRSWKGVEGRGRAWKGVEGRGRAWKGVEGRGRAWKGVEGWWKKAEMTHLHPEHAIEVHPRSMREGVLEDLHLLEEAQRVELRGKRGAQARGAMRASVC